ncbi:hypothetical protein PoB_001865700 [Plakobranchus ocellatus]|uniref:Uncharacterized protein n=1 Tax=Plakobranchus ocellatus TaxID=259542 RepID=A0AAV3ZC96_9GAST|nr:hypothetical protein PoB_001865700 [Plakobranchus ocellatus]
MYSSSTKWVAGKGGEVSNGKQPRDAALQEQSELYSWLPDAWTKHGTHFTVLVLFLEVEQQGGQAMSESLLCSRLHLEAELDQPAHCPLLDEIKAIFLPPRSDVETAICSRSQFR